MKLTFFALAFLFLIGCAPQESLTVYTDPPGATLYGQGGTTYSSPTTVYYYVDPAYVDSQGCMLVQQLTTVWFSGARVDARAAPLRLHEEQSAFAVTIERPDVPGLDQDMAWPFA